jgi:Protein of unknown function (DUF4254)
MAATVLLKAVAVVSFHDDCFAQSSWPPNSVLSLAPGANALTSVLHWAAENHRNNCLLWDQEDLARRTTVAATEIAANKRAIDGYNQARNDATERIDELLLISLGLVSAESAASNAPESLASPGARLNSETAGSMVDRLSILALKIKAMRWQLSRTDVTPKVLAASEQKLARLLEQRQDLANCFDALVDECTQGRAYFKVYRQFKMYNDASLNPALLAERKVG